MSDPRISTGTGRRAGSRIAIGVVVGPAAGMVLGLLVGLIAFEAGSRGMWASLIAGALFGVLLGGFWGGLSGLGPPAPRDDPLPRTDAEEGPPGSNAPRSRATEEDEPGGSSVAG